MDPRPLPTLPPLAPAPGLRRPAVNRKSGAPRSTSSADNPSLTEEQLRRLILETIGAGQQSFKGLFAALCQHGPVSLSKVKTVIGQLQTEGLVRGGSSTGKGKPYELGSDQRELPEHLHVRTIAAPPPAAGADDARLWAEIRRVLASGASYDPREVKRNIHTAFPGIELTQVAAALERMAATKLVERISLGTMTRYRRNAKAPEGIAS